MHILNAHSVSTVYQELCYALGPRSKPDWCDLYPPVVTEKEKNQLTVLDPKKPWVWVTGVQRGEMGLQAVGEEDQGDVL